MNKPLYVVTFFGKRVGGFGTCSGTAGVFNNRDTAEEYCVNVKSSNDGFEYIEFMIRPFMLDEGYL